MLTTTIMVTAIITMTSPGRFAVGHVSSSEFGVPPPPLRERGGEGGSNRLRRMWPPPSLSLPRKGGGDVVAQAIVTARPHELPQ